MTLRAANDLAMTRPLQPPSYKEVKAVDTQTDSRCATRPRRSHDLTLRMRAFYATALYGDHDATPDPRGRGDARGEERTRGACWAARILFTSGGRVIARRASSRTDDKTTSRCVICMDRRSDHFCIPCGHVVIVDRVRETLIGAERPVCRLHVERVQKREKRDPCGRRRAID